MKLPLLIVPCARIALLGAVISGFVLTPVPRAHGHTLIANESWGGVSHWSWLGVCSGDQVKFYRYVLGRSASGKEPFEILNLQSRADEIIYSGTRLGVRTGRMLQFFDCTRRFTHLPKLDLELREDVSELVLAGNRLGIRTGRMLKFYNVSANFEHLPKFDFVVPEGTSELLVTTNRMGN